MKRLKPWLLLALVFLVGVIVGVAGTRLVIRRIAREAALHPGLVQKAAEHRLARRLRLDANQRERLDQILTETRNQMQSLRQQYRPQAVLVFSNANAQINELLTPDQRERFEKFKEENAVFLRGLQSGP